jgi:glutamine amidotransferase
MDGLRGIDGEQIIGKRLAAGRPVLGVCVGMQIMFSQGIEFGVQTDGCGQWPAAVTRLDAPVIPAHGLRTSCRSRPASTLFRGLDAATRFYFVHSYAAPTLGGRPDALLTWATHQCRSWPPSRTARCRPPSSIREGGDAGATLLRQLGRKLG